MLELVIRRQMLRHCLLRQHNNLAFPLGGEADAGNPFRFSHRVRLTNVVDSTDSSIVDDRKSDCGCDVIDISASPLPSGVILFQEDRAAAILDPFQMIERPMIAGSV